MGKNAPRINALVGLLGSYDPATLEALRTSYSAYELYLKPGNLLGNKLGAKDDAVDIARVYSDVALKGLETARERVQPNLQRLRRRLGRAKTIRFSGQLVAAVTSAGLLTAILAGWEREAIAPAVLNFSAIVCALGAGYLETPLHGGSGNLIEMFEKLVTMDVRALQLSEELYVLQQTGAGADRVLEKVAEANELATKLRVIEQMLWGSRGSLIG